MHVSNSIPTVSVPGDASAPACAALVDNAAVSAELRCASGLLSFSRPLFRESRLS